jgi:hypothetical protein
VTAFASLHPHPQFNLDDGGGSRLLSILSWLKQQRAGVAGLVELNGWNHDLMLSRANLSGFPYAHLFQVRSLHA